MFFFKYWRVIEGEKNDLEEKFRVEFEEYKKLKENRLDINSIFLRFFVFYLLIENKFESFIDWEIN